VHLHCCSNCKNVLRLPQRKNKWVLPMNRFVHCSHKHIGPNEQMEECCRQQSLSHSRRNNISLMEKCTNSNQYCWNSYKMNRSLNTANIHTMVDGTTNAFTGAIQLVYKRHQHTHKQAGNQKCAHCMSTNSVIYHIWIFQVEQAHQSKCTLQGIYRHF